jgi:hypothetical protein
MPEDVYTQETDPSIPSYKSDRDSTNFTRSVRSAHRSDAPEEPTLGERVFAAYEHQEVTEVEDLPVRIMRSSDNNESYTKFSGLYGMYEEELVAQEGGPISRYRQWVGAFRVWNAFRFVIDSDTSIPTEYWCKDDHKALRDCFKADTGSPLYLSG